MKHSVRVVFLDKEEKTRNEIQQIGVDSCIKNSIYQKVFNPGILIDCIKNVAANIIKQEMLSLKGDAAVSRGTINHSIETTDILLTGNLKIYKKLTKKLRSQPFGLPLIADEIDNALKNFLNPVSIFRCGKFKLDLTQKIHVMGALNVTPDSFFDGGKYTNRDKALFQAEKMVEEGADIIDIGGESTRPGATPVNPEEEIKRIIPLVATLTKKFSVPISVDTYKSRVAKMALNEGASIVNDISGLRFDPLMPQTIKEYNAGAVIMHIKGTPQNMQTNPSYNHLLLDIFRYLNESIIIAEKHGIFPDQIIIDPGIGFGKTTKDNLKIINALSELKALGKPILIGVSRKSFIGNTLELPPEERLTGSIASASIAAINGARIIRTHDVLETVRAAKIIKAIDNAWSEHQNG